MAHAVGTVDVVRVFCEPLLTLDLFVMLGDERLYGLLTSFQFGDPLEW